MTKRVLRLISQTMLAAAVLACGSLASSARADGNVTFYEAGGNIELWGDGRDNAVEMTVVHRGYDKDAVLRVKGLFNTTINHHAAIELVVSNLGDLVIDLRDGGENRVFIEGLMAHQADSSLQVFGSGGDLIQLEDSEFTDIEIEGISTLICKRSEARTHFTVGPTPLEDTVDLNDCRADVLSIETKEGGDTVKIDGGVYDELSIDTGVPYPLLNHTSKIVLRMAPDDDFVELFEVTVAGDLDVSMGMAADELETKDVWVQGHTRFDGGVGADAASLSGDYDESNAPQGPTQVQGGFYMIPWPIIEEIPVNPTIDIVGFETVLGFNNPN